MRLTYVMPEPAVQACVSVYCHGEADGTPLTHVVPALLGQVHIRLAGESAYEFADGRVVEAPQVAICGPFNEAFRMRTSGDFLFIGFGLLPTGWSTLLGLSAAAIADDVVDGAALWPAGRLETLTDQLSAVRLPQSRGAILDAFITDQLKRKTYPLDQRIEAIDRWVEHSSDLPVDPVLGELGISARQFARVTLTAYGCSPKRLAMKYRALRAAATLAVEGPSAVDFAMQGYSDQPHFIREFRRFVGWTPGAYVRDQSSLARDTLRGRWELGARRPLSLWS